MPSGKTINVSKTQRQSPIRALHIRTLMAVTTSHKFSMRTALRSRILADQSTPA